MSAATHYDDGGVVAIDGSYYADMHRFEATAQRDVSVDHLVFGDGSVYVRVNGTLLDHL